MDELESISILKSYVESIDELARGDMKLAQELSYWIIQYGIKGIEPPEDTSPFVMSPFKQIKKALDRGRIKGFNARKDSNENQNEIKTETKSNQNENEIKTKRDKIKNKKENKNNLISLSKDKEEKNSYGDEEINECLEIIKSYNNGIINGSNQKGRQYSKHLISKLKKIENVKDGKIKWQDILRMILEVGKENEYYSVKTTSPELIYYNLSTLMEVCRKQFKKQQGQKILTAL